MESDLWKFATDHSLLTEREFAWMGFEDLERFVADGGVLSNASRVVKEYPNDLCFLWRQIIRTDDKAFVRVRARSQGAIVDRLCWCSKSPIVPRAYSLYPLGKLRCAEVPWDSLDAQIDLIPSVNRWHKLWISWDQPSEVETNTGIRQIEHFVKRFGKRTASKFWKEDDPGVPLPLRELRQYWWNSGMMDGNYWSTVFDEIAFARDISSICQVANVDVDSDAVQIECTLFDLESCQLQLGDLLVATATHESAFEESLSQIPVWSTSPIIWRLAASEVEQFRCLPKLAQGAHWVSIWTGHDLLPLVCRLGRGAWDPCSHHELPDRELLPRYEMTHDQKQAFLRRFSPPDRVLVAPKSQIEPDASVVELPSLKGSATPLSTFESPTFLSGLVHPAVSNASEELKKGKFCGHGEPTFAVFDIAIDEQVELELAAWMGNSETQDPELLLARVPGTGTKWLTLFNQKWFTPEGNLKLPDSPQWIEVPLDDKRIDSKGLVIASLAIGFEYPSDAQNENDISWLTIDAWPKGHKGKPVVLVDVETA